jgi:hemolysin activation/secretion protein
MRIAFSEAKPDGASHLIDEVTRTEDASIYASYVPVRSRALSVRLTAAAGAREVQETNNTATGYTDHIRAVALSAEVRSQDLLGGGNYLTVAARQGIPGIGASVKGDPDSSRPEAREDFSKLFVNYNRVQPLGGPFSLWLAASGQWSTGPLLRSEEFFVGGSAFGRAFAPGAFWGDSGLAGLAELRIDQPLDGRLGQGYQLYAFLDRAALWASGFDYQQISSYGGGLRLFVNEDLRAGLEVAAPIEVPALARDPGTRVYFSLSRTFRGCPLGWCD